MCQMISPGTGVESVRNGTQVPASAPNHSAVDNKIARVLHSGVEVLAAVSCDKQHLSLKYSTAIEK